MSVLNRTTLPFNVSRSIQHRKERKMLISVWKHHVSMMLNRIFEICDGKQLKQLFNDLYQNESLYPEYLDGWRKWIVLDSSNIYNNYHWGYGFKV